MRLWWCYIHIHMPLKCLQFPRVFVLLTRSRGLIDPKWYSGDYVFDSEHKVLKPENFVQVFETVILQFFFRNKQIQVFIYIKLWILSSWYMHCCLSWVLCLVSFLKLNLAPLLFGPMFLCVLNFWYYHTEIDSVVHCSSSLPFALSFVAFM
jgi:hypothetical protein